MEPQNLRFGGGATETLLHPFVAVELAIAIILILCIPRKYALAPLLLVRSPFPWGKSWCWRGSTSLYFVFSFWPHWVGGRRPNRPCSLAASTTIDRSVTLWTLSSLVIVSIQWMQTPILIKSLGDFLDALGGYYVVRFLIRDVGDVRRRLRCWPRLR